MFFRGKKGGINATFFLHFSLLQASHIAGHCFNFLVTETKRGGAHDFCVAIVGATGRVLVALAIRAQLVCDVLRVLSRQRGKAGRRIALTGG